MAVLLAGDEAPSVDEGVVTKDDNRVLHGHKRGDQSGCGYSGRDQSSGIKTILE